MDVLMRDAARDRRPRSAQELAGVIFDKRLQLDVGFRDAVGRQVLERTARQGLRGLRVVDREASRVELLFVGNLRLERQRERARKG